MDKVIKKFIRYIFLIPIFLVVPAIILLEWATNEEDISLVETTKLIWTIIKNDFI